MNNETFGAASRMSRRRFVGLSALVATLPLTHELLTGVTGASAQSGPADFLDGGSVHEISVDFDSVPYEAMIATFQQTGDKEWIEATVTIDGATYENVGLRLKGNSSLMGLRNRGGMGEGRVGGATAEEPERLPWLIRLDEFVRDQNHLGMEQLVVRSNNSATSLNEAVALVLLDEAGLASQQAAFARFRVNGSDSLLRLTIENPKGKWMRAHFPSDGLLFKSEAEGDWSYRGDDYGSYLKTAFDLEAGSTDDDAADFAPLIALLDFLNNSDDATFVAELPAWVELDLFAVYLAMMDLVGNFDDIDGPGNNSYLYFNRSDEQFTIVPWDMNLAFGGMRSMGPGTEFTGPGGALGRPPGTQGDDIRATPDAGAFPSTIPGNLPEGGPQEWGQSRGGGFPGGGRANPLVRRFSANRDWTALVAEETERLRSELFASGVAAGVLNRWVAVIEAGASDLIDSQTVAAEAGSIASFF